MESMFGTQKFDIERDYLGGYAIIDSRDGSEICFVYRDGKNGDFDAELAQMIAEAPAVRAERDRLARALDEAQATCRALGKTAENFAAELAALTGHLDQLEADREYNAALVTERSAELAALKAAMPEDAALLLYRISTLAEDMADNWRERADVEEARAWAARLEAASVSQFVEAGQSDRRPQEVAA